MVAVDSRKFHLPAMELRFLSMADRGREWRGKKASGGWESVEGVEEDGGAALVLLHIHRPSKSRDGGGSNGGGCSLHGGHVPDTRHPLKHKREHLAGDGMARVGRPFGSFLGRIRRWAKNEVCQARPALQI